MPRPPITIAPCGRPPARPAGHLAAFVLLTSILQLACARGGYTTKPPPPEGRPRTGALLLRRAFAEAADLFLSGDFDRARDAFRCIASEERDPFRAARAFHLWGRCELALGRPGAARAAFTRALSSAPGDGGRIADLRAYALAGLADAALAAGRPAEALDHLQRIADEGLSGRLAADALVYRRASALDNLGRSAAAARDYRRLARTWPSSALASGSRARAEALVPRGLERAVDWPSAYEVQTGVFSDRDSAEAAADALRRRGFRARVDGLSPGEDGRFVVCIGRFSAREAADALAGEAERAGFPARVSP